MSIALKVTTAGAAAIANAATSGQSVAVQRIAFGTDGTPHTVASGALGSQVGSFLVESITKSGNTVTFALTIPKSWGGHTLREVALLTSTGLLLAVGNLADFYKPAPGGANAFAVEFTASLTVSDPSTIATEVEGVVVGANSDLVAVSAARDEAVAARTAAEDAQTSAEYAFHNFDTRYLGAKSVFPDSDNDGDPLIEGALFWQTSAKKYYVWTGSSWSAIAVREGSIVLLDVSYSNIANNTVEVIGPARAATTDDKLIYLPAGAVAPADNPQWTDDPNALKETIRDWVRHEALPPVSLDWVLLNWQQKTAVGSAAIAYANNINSLFPKSGTTPNSFARIYFNNNNWPLGPNGNGAFINWTCRNTLFANIHRRTENSEGNLGIFLGKTTNSADGLSPFVGIGIYCEGGDLFAVLDDDGPPLQKVDLGVSIPKNKSKTVVLDAVNGNVRVYVDSALNATLTGGPTNPSAVGSLSIEIENGSDAIDEHFWLRAQSYHFHS